MCLCCRCRWDANSFSRVDVSTLDWVVQREGPGRKSLKSERPCPWLVDRVQVNGRRRRTLRRKFESESDPGKPSLIRTLALGKYRISLV